MFGSDPAFPKEFRARLEMCQERAFPRADGLRSGIELNHLLYERVHPSLAGSCTGVQQPKAKEPLQQFLPRVSETSWRVFAEFRELPCSEHAYPGQCDVVGG